MDIFNLSYDSPKFAIMSYYIILDPNSNIVFLKSGTNYILKARAHTVNHKTLVCHVVDLFYMLLFLSASIYVLHWLQNSILHFSNLICTLIIFRKPGHCSKSYCYPNI